MSDVRTTEYIFLTAEYGIWKNGVYKIILAVPVQIWQNLATGPNSICR